MNKWVVDRRLDWGKDERVTKGGLIRHLLISKQFTVKTTFAQTSGHSFPKNPTPPSISILPIKKYLPLLNEIQCKM